MFGIKIMDTGIKMVACSQKWDLFLYQLIGSNGKDLQKHKKNLYYEYQM